MKKLIWFLLEMMCDNRGYSTPIQKRFKVGDKARISEHSDLIFGVPITIIECARYDYLIELDNGEKHIVYQFELQQFEINI